MACLLIYLLEQYANSLSTISDKEIQCNLVRLSPARNAIVLKTGSLLDKMLVSFVHSSIWTLKYGISSKSNIFVHTKQMIPA